MTAPVGVVLERFHHTTLRAGIAQLDLSCFDPSCMAEPGEACRPFCTHGEPSPAAEHADLVEAFNGMFAVRHCPRCNGSGLDAASPDQDECRCLVTALRELEMRATALYWQAKGEQQDTATAARTLATVLRLDAEALATALGRQGVAATVHVGSSPVHAVAIDTRHGRVFAGRDRTKPNTVLVQRADGTQWTLSVLGDGVSAIAWTLRHVVPELADEGTRMDYIVAVMPEYSNTCLVVWRGHDARRGAPCPTCRKSVTGECPGAQKHMRTVHERLRGLHVPIIYGAFPMPADALTVGPTAAAACDKALTPIANLIWRRELVIS